MRKNWYKNGFLLIKRILEEISCRGDFQPGKWAPIWQGDPRAPPNSQTARANSQETPGRDGGKKRAMGALRAINTKTIAPC